MEEQILKAIANKGDRKLVLVLTGAGISAESGIPTFRDMGGTWEKYDIMEVATPEGWRKNPELVLDFYNQRRRDAAAVQPNEGHFALKRLEEKYLVVIITQNVDALHEKAGSTHIIHLHGELSKVRSTVDPNLVYEIGDKPIQLGDKCDKGSQLRPHIVWFHEDVPLINLAYDILPYGDIFMVVGTSLKVYPAAGLIDLIDPAVPKYVIDRSLPEVAKRKNLFLIEQPATVGVPQVVEELLTKE